MKKITVLSGLILVCTFLKAQNFTVAVTGGMSVNKTAIAGFNVGMNFRDFNIRTGLDRHLSSSIDAGTIFKTYFGHTFDFNTWYFNPGIGHAYSLKSTDRKALNYNAVLYNAEFGYKWDFKGEAMATYISYSHAGEFNLISVGMRGIFSSKNDCNH